MITEDRIKKLFSRSGFILLWEESLKNYRTNKQAFEKLNEEFENIFGRRRYSEYASFKNQLSRYRKKRNQ